jgi:hypothetical protein
MQHRRRGYTLLNIMTRKKTMDIKKNDVMGKSGILADGRKVNVRQVSSAGCPTLEIRPPPGTQDKKIKIRYPEPNN